MKKPITQKIIEFIIVIAFTIFIVIGVLLLA